MSINSLSGQIQNVLRNNGLELEVSNSAKSFSEYIGVIIRGAQGDVDYRLKIRVSDHNIPRGTYATVDIRSNEKLSNAMDLIKKSHCVLTNIIFNEL